MRERGGDSAAGARNVRRGAAGPVRSSVLRIALKMLFGDRAKYVTLVLGLAFAALLMNQQGAIFLGLLRQSTGPLQNVHQPDLWVVDPGTEWVAEYRSLSDQKLARVRSTPGVEWAEPFFNAYAVTELSNGSFKRVQILGIPRTTLVGRPTEVIGGRVEDLWIPDSILVELSSVEKMGGVKVGDVIKINDRRALVVGYAKAKKGFESNAIIYTTFDNAVSYTPVGRERISYILVKCKPGVPVEEVRGRIDALGDVAALTPDEFRERTKRFLIVATGIGINFFITIALGFLVGLLLSASIFYLFIVENLRYYAVLKALGAGVWRIIGMVLLQALVVGLVGYGIGVGIAGLFTIVSRVTESELQVHYPWQLLVGSLFGTLGTIAVGSFLSLRKVISVSPGKVFGG